MKEYPYMKSVVVLLYHYFARISRNLSPLHIELACKVWCVIPLWLEEKKKSEPISDLENLVRIILVWCGRWDLNPYVIQHTPLKRACLPIPALPHIHFLHQRCNMYIIRNPLEFVNPFFEKSFLRRFSKDAKAAFTPPSLGLFVLLFV